MKAQDKQIVTPYSFRQTGLQPYVCKLLQHNSYVKPTPIQYYGIKNAIQNPQNSFICKAKSGTGKTLAYVGVILYGLARLEALEDRTYCVVVSPTRELAVQIYQTLKVLLDSATNVKATTDQQKRIKQILLKLTPMLTIGGLSFEDDRKKYHESPCHILICTVGRLWQLFRNNILILSKDITIVFDEGDKLFTTSDDKFMRVLKFVERGQWLIFSATFDRKLMLNLLRTNLSVEAKKWVYVQTALKNGELEVVVTDQLEERLMQQEKEELSVQNIAKDKKQPSLLSDPENLHLSNIKKYQIVLPPNPNQPILDQKLSKLSQLLSRLHYQKCLIFIQKKSFLEQISQYLSSSSFEHVLIHGSLNQAARFRMMNRINDNKIILASDLLARGIDIKLDLVVLFDVRHCDTFWHRIGRTGRYGRTGVVVSLEKVQEVAAEGGQGGQGEGKWLQYQEDQVNKILDGIDQYQKKEWYGGHMTEIGRWQDYDVNKQQQNNYKYFNEQQFEQTIKQISQIEQHEDAPKSPSPVPGQLNQINPPNQSKYNQILSSIKSKSELQEFIKFKILKCQKCLSLIEGTTQLTGYNFHILKYIQQ